MVLKTLITVADLGRSLLGPPPAPTAANSYKTQTVTSLSLHHSRTVRIAHVRANGISHIHSRAVIHSTTV